MSEIGRRLIAVGGERVEVESFEVPEPGPSQALVRIHRTQVSGGSEIAGFLLQAKGERPKRRRPLGYTAVGHVLAVGPEMDRFKPGDRVITLGNHGTHCLTGAPSDSSPVESVQHVSLEQATPIPSSST